MDAEYETFLRAALFLTGMWVAGHHFMAANALKRAPHLVKLVLMPATVVSGIGMCWGAWFMSSGVAMLWCIPAVMCMSVTEFLVWRAGAFISSAFEQQAEMKEQMRQHWNRFRYDLTLPAQEILTDSGKREVADSDKRAKERA